jgi:DNA-binding NtrC family response regulator
MSQQQPRILLVDDDADVLGATASILEDSGYDVARCANGEIALLFMKEGVAFDLILTDVVLPGRWDGFALAHRAREILPDISVLYATGYGDVARVRSRGAIYGEVLAKPCRRDALLRAVRTALRTNVSLSANAKS